MLSCFTILCGSRKFLSGFYHIRNFDMSTHPKLTVVLPAHNAETTIAASMQSILYQSYSDFELWVLENGSSDRTAEIAKSFIDPKVKVFELQRVGLQYALGYALENAQSEWLARMDADDLSFPERLERQMEVVEHKPDIIMVGTRCVYLTPFGHIFETRPNASSREIGALNLRLLGDDARFFHDPSAIFKRSVALDVGGYDSEFQMGDLPLWFRMLQRGRGWEIAKPLYLYRLHPNSLSYTKIASSDELYRLMVKYVPELLHLHFPGESFQQKPASWHQQRYWLRMAAYEALTGDRKAILQAIENLDRNGPLKNEARLLKWFTFLGSLGVAYYRWHRRNKYRHRPDLEKLFTDLFGPLSLS